jgi:hypothetical protein
MTPRSTLYTLARRLGDVQALASGNPHRIARRARNVAVGRLLARTGAWSKLWGGGR